MGSESPLVFFFREFFSRALLSECLEQASKLQLISPGLTNLRKGWCSRSCITRIEKKRYRYRSAGQNTFYIYWFLIEPQNVMINRIHFHTFGGGSYPGKLMGLWLGGARGPYQCRRLEAAVYVKWPILFSTFNMMSDWISWFNFTEDVKGFHGWFLMIVFHGLAGISLLSFATAMASQSVTVFTIYTIQ